MSAQQRPTADDRLFDSLRQELIDKLQASGTFSTFTSPDRSTIKAKTLTGTDLTISLDNLASDVRAKPQQRNEIVARFIRVIAGTAATSKEESEPTKADFLASMRPVLRAKSYVDQIAKAAAGKPEQMLLSWPFAGDAVVLIAIDGSEQVRMMSGADAAAHDLAKDAVLETALANVRALVPAFRLERSAPFVALSVPEDYYTGALLLLPEIVNQLEAELGADFLLLLPDRNSAVAARTRDAAQLRQLAAAAAQQRKADALLPHFLQRTGGAWKPFPAR